MTTNAQAERIGATHYGVVAPLDLADAMDLLAAVVNCPGQHVRPSDTNRYTSGGQPCGVVGYALSKANVAIADLEAMCGKPLRELYRRDRMPIPITLGALIVLDAAQRSQDRGRHGDKVLDDAVAVAARFLDLVSVLPSVSSLSLGGVIMRIHARELAAGDVLAMHDWRLHVVAVERDRAVGVRTAEFDFLIHLLNDELVDIQRCPYAA